MRDLAGQREVLRWRHSAGLSLFASAAVVLAGSAAPALGAGFAVAVSPPRFELQGAPGQVVREILEIGHAEHAPQHLRIATADWRLMPDGAIDLMDVLDPQSCRPWVAIERRELELPPRSRVRYRFETRIPEGAPAGECRYALLIEGTGTAGDASTPFDVQGRLAVVVYVRVGNARAQLSLEGVQRSVDASGPTLTVHNRGSATGRLSGQVRWLDARGTEQRLEPEDSPILPGSTRRIQLRAAATDSAIKTTGTPLFVGPGRLQGRLEVDSGADPVVLDHAID